MAEQQYLQGPKHCTVQACQKTLSENKRSEDGRVGLLMEIKHDVTEKDHCGECFNLFAMVLLIIFPFGIIFCSSYLCNGNATEPISKVKNASVCIKDHLNSDFHNRMNSDGFYNRPHSLALPTVSEFDKAKNRCHSAALRKEEGLSG